jgi:glutamate/tyrosine decarboxylase-like PLP-dependent enzyme
MPSSESYDYLASFLGPFAENSELFEDLLLVIVRDYTHWRKNYFPADPTLLTRAQRRDHIHQHDILSQNVHKLMADLRRNFPFYSPRYLAHQLSDTQLPGMLGYLAGMLFNPNNVTAEAAPVTVDLEIDACNAILTMLGFAPAPEIPKRTEDPGKYYERMSANEFGWAHLASGGTSANIEALWVAREVRYFPLSVKDVARQHGLAVEVKLPDNTARSIVDIDDRDLLLIKPNESIYLLSRYFSALRLSGVSKSSDDKLGKFAWKLLKDSKYALSRGVAEIFAKFPPVVLVAGTAHYSVAKAANVVGIGSDNVIPITPDEHFRMDVEDLRSHLARVVKQGAIPLCVIATAGTTEEGAVDPIHDIVDLRGKLENEADKSARMSFWLHIDAAWGGFVRSLFQEEPASHARDLMSKASRVLGINPPTTSPVDWHRSFAQHVDRTLLAGRPRSATEEAADADKHSKNPESGDIDKSAIESGTRSGASKRIGDLLAEMESLLSRGEYARYCRRLESFPRQLQITDVTGPPEPSSFEWTFTDTHDRLTRFVQDKINFSIDRYERSLSFSWPATDVCSAFMSFGKADSITVDPHKMGYLPYPCGCVAFRNDRVRHFILQEAPYITASKLNVLVHLPPRHAAASENGAWSVKRAAFGPFILEGSRPGAAAAGLWLAVKTLPLTREHHGAIVRASLLAARQIYEWLVRWNAIHQKLERDLDYEFIPLTGRPPDTNLVTFVVKKRTSGSLLEMNCLTKRVYDEFSIQAELGEMQYSYSQPFFISRTEMKAPTYPPSSVEKLFTRCRLNHRARVEYLEHGVTVLRAAVMNPYITPLRVMADYDIVRLFLEELAAAAQKHVRSL